MKALIIGGGIAGPIAAIALRRAGIQSAVFEAHPGWAESLGLFLGLGVNGMRVLRDLDLLEPLQRTDTIATPRMEFSSTTGKRLGVVSNGRLDARTPSLTVMRGALQRALVEEARARGIEICYGKRLVAYSEDTGGVIARFADGSHARGDILIGADGIHSVVRKGALPRAPSPNYTGLLNLGGVVAASGLPPTPDTMHMVWGRRAFFGYTVRSSGEAWWFANIGSRREPSREELARISTSVWKGRLTELFVSDPGLINGLIRRTPEIGAHPIHDMPSLPSWHTGRAVLVGDAAHAVSPSAGQGASLAMEDAVMLAICLRDHPGPELAFERYEEARRPRAERIVALGRRRGEYKALDSDVAIWIRDLLMPIAFRLFAREKAMSWIYDYHIPWGPNLQPNSSSPSADALGRRHAHH